MCVVVVVVLFVCFGDAFGCPVSFLSFNLLSLGDSDISKSPEDGLSSAGGSGEGDHLCKLVFTQHGSSKVSAPM